MNLFPPQILRTQTLDVYLLFASCYLDGTNSIKTDLHICNSWTGHFVSLDFNKFALAEQQKVNKHPKFDANYYTSNMT